MQGNGVGAVTKDDAEWAHCGAALESYFGGPPPCQLEVEWLMRERAGSKAEGRRESQDELSTTYTELAECKTALNRANAVADKWDGSAAGLMVSDLRDALKGTP